MTDIEKMNEAPDGPSASKAQLAKCPYCGKEIHKAVPRKIIDRSRNQYGKAYVRERMIDFCSMDCGDHYQMGCEG